MVFKSTLLLAISATLVLSTQALSLRDTPLGKRSEDQLKKYEINEKDQKCIKDAVALNPTKYKGDATEQILAYTDLVLKCARTPDTQMGAQGQSTPPPQNQFGPPPPRQFDLAPPRQFGQGGQGGQGGF
ncbi:hypothetical protein BC941DRAFT_457003 [Chlamydoabsidia padenii]|nr:hypothetical protein BC941DRAFT_457003 [Chlamydoabsidia padenii]